MIVMCCHCQVKATPFRTVILGWNRWYWLVGGTWYRARELTARYARFAVFPTTKRPVSGSELCGYRTSCSGCKSWPFCWLRLTLGALIYSQNSTHVLPRQSFFATFYTVAVSIYLVAGCTLRVRTIATFLTNFRRSGFPPLRSGWLECIGEHMFSRCTLSNLALA